MDKRDLEEISGLKEDLVLFCRRCMPVSKAEIEIGTKFEYSDKFVEFIVTKVFIAANTIEEIPNLIQDMVGDRKQRLVSDNGKAIDIVMQGHFNEHPLVVDYDAKRGTLLKYNNRTISKIVESDLDSENIKSKRSKIK